MNKDWTYIFATDGSSGYRRVKSVFTERPARASWIRVASFKVASWIRNMREISCDDPEQNIACRGTLLTVSRLGGPAKKKRWCRRYVFMISEHV